MMLQSSNCGGDDGSDLRYKKLVRGDVSAVWYKILLEKNNLIHVMTEILLQSRDCGGQDGLAVRYKTFVVGD